MRLARTDTSVLARWWFTVDRMLLIAILALIGSGLVLSLAASPAVAVRRGLPVFHFFERHLAFAAAGVVLMIVLSLLDPRRIRRLCLVLFALAVALMVAVLFVGPEINGARRWIRIGGSSLQPSEIAKPAFVVLTAWLFAESERRRDVPARALAIGAYVVFAVLLVLEPDVGQTLLVTLVWVTMFFVSGMPVRWLVGFAVMLPLAAGGAYAAFGHVRGRVHRFLDPASGDNYQVEKALEAITRGRLLGRGPGEGTVKTVLPDAHTDFVLAVIAEEYGVLACLVLVALIAFIVLKALARALGSQDPFARNAVTGLALLFALQSMINLSVNTGLIPAKGLTLPFVSYGGTSMLAMATVMGLLLSLSRRRLVDHDRQKNSSILTSTAAYTTGAGGVS
jgi:cell division protein FtsW